MAGKIYKGSRWFQVADNILYFMTLVKILPDVCLTMCIYCYIMSTQ